MYTVAEIAKRLGVSPNTVYSAVETGLLECHRLKSKPGARGTIRVSDEQLTKYLESMKVEKRQNNTSFPRDTVGGAFKNLDSGRLLDAWRRQGVIDEPCEDNAR